MLSRKHLWRAARVVLCVTVMALPALAAIDAYMKITGQKQGEIRGSVTQKGREGQVEVTAVQHDIEGPNEQHAAQASGKRQHKPIALTIRVDAASPKLQKALEDNEELSEVT